MDIMTIMTILGVVAGALTTGSLLPQAIKTLKTKKTRDISLITYIMSVTGIILWIVYGAYVKDIPILFANIVAIALSGTILICKLRYG